MKRFSIIPGVRTFYFFVVDWSIIDAKLFFEAPTQPGMMIDDAAILGCVHVVVEIDLGKLGPNAPNHLQGHTGSNPKSSASQLTLVRSYSYPKVIWDSVIPALWVFKY